MDRYHAALRLWKETKRLGDVWVRLEHFQHILDTLKRIPDGTDMLSTTEVTLRIRTWLHGMTVEEALDRVATATFHGIDPLVLEETLRFIVQSQGGFVRTDLATLVFRYTFTQIRMAKLLWDGLPPHDRANVTVDMLLDASLEGSADVVNYVVGDLGSIQGPGLKLAAMIKDCVSPQVAYELWKQLRMPGPVKQEDMELMLQVLEVIGMHETVPEDGMGALMTEEQTVRSFDRGTRQLLS